MKILIIHNKYKEPGGEDSVCKAESELLLSYGHEVQHMLYDNATIKTFFDKCFSGLKTIYNPDSAHALRIKIKTFAPDIIHIHNFLPLVSPSVLFVANWSNVPVVMTLHNYRLICPSATLFFKGKIYEKSIHSVFPFDAIWKGVYRNSKIQTAIVALMTGIHKLIGTWKNKVDCYIALTEFAKGKFENSSLAIPERKLIVKSNFVQDYGKGAIPRQDYFLFVGRLTEEKGIRTILKAAADHTFKFIIIGDGPLKPIVEDAAEYNPNLKFLGYQSKSIVVDYLKNCKALIFPSIWYEGFPVAIAEAFSTGTPVVASNLGSLTEIIQDRKNGLHFEAGNSSDLILKLRELNGDSVLAKKLSDNARQSYLDDYTAATNYPQLIGIYLEAIERRQVAKNKLGQYFLVPNRNSLSKFDSPNTLSRS